MNSTEKTRILHVINSLNDGGAEAVLYRLVTSDRAFDHHVVTLLDDGKYGALLREAGIRVECLGARKPARFLSKFLQLYRIMARMKPDLVQTWMYHSDLFGGLAARLAGVRPVVWGIHHTTLDAEKSSATTRRIAALCARLSHVIPTRIISCSQRGLEIHRDQGYRAEALRFVPNGHDVARFTLDPAQRQAFRQSLSVGDDTLLLGCVARYAPQKDHKTLIAALHRLKTRGVAFRALLIGRGLDPGNDTLVRTIAEHGLEDDILLMGPRPDIPEIMNGLDIHVLSSAFGEAFPNVICEAMACGTPCVATDVGDAGAIIGDTGEICPPSDPAALAEALLRCQRRLAEEPDLPARCRDRIVSNFALDIIMARYGAIWTDSIRACR